MVFMQKKKNSFTIGRTLVKHVFWQENQQQVCPAILILFDQPQLSADEKIV